MLGSTTERDIEKSLGKERQIEEIEREKTKKVRGGGRNH